MYYSGSVNAFVLNLINTTNSQIKLIPFYINVAFFLKLGVGLIIESEL